MPFLPASLPTGPGVRARLRRLLSTAPRRIAAIVLAVLVVAGVIAAVIPKSSGPNVRAEDFRITVPGGPGVTDPVVLDSTLYVPPTVPAPAVIMAHGFGGSKDSVAADARDLAAKGYVVLAYSARGFGASTGLIGLDSLDYEIPDARALVDWLAQRKEVIQDKPGDPRVGVTGGSYGGALSLMLAGTDPRIDAVVPIITWNDLAQSLFPNDVATGAAGATPAASSGSADGVFKKAWAASLISSVTTGRAVTSATVAQADNGDSGFGRGQGSAGTTGPTANSTVNGTGRSPLVDPGTAGCGRLQPALCAGYAEAAQTGKLPASFAALLERSSPKSVVSNIKAPTLLVQGERDTLFGLDQADANARAIAANGTTVAMTWYSGGHDGGSPDQATEDRITAWFDHYLARKGPAPGTAFVYSVDGPVSDTGRTRTRTLQANQYPGLVGGSTTRHDLPLTGAAQPAVNPPGGSPAGISSLPGLSGLVGSALSSLSGGLPGQTARFTSAPVGALTVITGTPRIQLQVQRLSGSGDGVLFVSLSKVSDTGQLTLAGNAVAPIRLTDLGTAPQTVTVDLPAVAFQVEAGSRLQVAVTTTDQAYAGPAEPAVYRIAAAGPLSYPEVPGVRISAGEIPVGVLVALIVLVVIAVGALLLGGRVRRRAQVTPGDPTIPLEIVGLRKEYPGGVAAVQDVSLRVEPGQVLGLLGPNGAGKTTTLRMVMGLISPSAGQILVFGEPVRPGAEILSRIGSFVEGSGFLPHLSGRANLELYWAATGRPVDDAHFDIAVEIAGLGAAINRRVRTYSQGMRQRLAIAQAMLGLPDLLLLDEPTNGLDPPQIHAMREVLRRYAATGRTVLVSSHLLSEVEQTCSHVVVVHRGRTIAAGTVTELVSASGETVFEVGDVDAALAVVRDLPEVTVVGHEGTWMVLDLPSSGAAPVVAALVSAGVSVAGVAPRNRLEDVFLDLVGAGQSAGAGTNGRESS